MYLRWHTPRRKNLPPFVCTLTSTGNFVYSNLWNYEDQGKECKPLQIHHKTVMLKFIPLFCYVTQKKWQKGQSPQIGTVCAFACGNGGQKF